MLLPLAAWNRHRLRRVASINPLLLPGPWELRGGRRALPLPVRLPFPLPKGSFLRSWIDRGRGWEPFDLDPVPPVVEGAGWWADGEILVRLPPGLLLSKAWEKVRLGSWRRQTERPPRVLPRPDLRSRPLVSVLIPTSGRTVPTLRGPLDLARNCVRSIERKSSYANLEILVGVNGPESPAVPFVRIDPPGPFNLARKLNLMMERARGEYVVLLNDDTEVIEPGWIEALLAYAQAPDVGAAGARLHYPDGRLQHAGLVFGQGPLCGHAYAGHPYDCPAAARPRECSAVTGACLLLRRGIRLDERFPNAFDAEVCLRLRAAGRRVVYAPDARLFHLESASLALGERSRFRELLRLRRRWPACLPDPFYVEDRPDCAHDDSSAKY